MLTRKLLLEHYKEIIKNHEAYLKEQNEDFKVAVITNEQVKEGGIFMFGINPSGSKGPEEFDYHKCWDLKEKDKFWDPKHVMMGSNPIKKEYGIDGYDKKCGYLDLFPIRQSSQKRFTANNDKYNELMGQLLSETQDYIEELHPKLIISANQDSFYYWGFEYNKQGKGFWMGYNRIKVESPLIGKQDKGYWKLWKITGIEPSGVNKGRNTTRLLGSYFLQYRQHKDLYQREVPENRRLTQEDIKTIVEWIDPEWAKTLL